MIINEALVRLLLNKGVEVKIVGGKFSTALRAAVAIESESITRLLLDAGADINVEVTASHTTKDNKWFNTEFTSTLQLASASCNVSIFQLLLDHGMVLSPEYIEEALAQVVTANTLENKLKMIDFLVAKGTDIKRYGSRALISACGYNSEIEIVHKLLSLGAPLNWAK